LHPRQGRWVRALDRRAARRVARARRAPGRTRGGAHPSDLAHRHARRRFPLVDRPNPEGGLRMLGGSIGGPLLALSGARIKQFLREPGALFWTFGFPLLIT